MIKMKRLITKEIEILFCTPTISNSGSAKD